MVTKADLRASLTLLETKLKESVNKIQSQQEVIAKLTAENNSLKLKDAESVAYQQKDLEDYIVAVNNLVLLLD